jgi:hypothetical protein
MKQYKATDGVNVRLMTVKDIAESLGVKAVDANGFIAVLVHQGVLVKSNETQPAAGGRGKPSNLYEVPEGIELVMWENANENANENAVVKTAPASVVAVETVPLAVPVETVSEVAVEAAPESVNLTV